MEEILRLVSHRACFFQCPALHARQHILLSARLCRRPALATRGPPLCAALWSGWRRRCSHRFPRLAGVRPFPCWVPACCAPRRLAPVGCLMRPPTSASLCNLGASSAPVCFAPAWPVAPPLCLRRTFRNGGQGLRERLARSSSSAASLELLIGSSSTPPMGTSPSCSSFGATVAVPRTMARKRCSHM